MKASSLFTIALLSFATTSCNGIFENLYDTPPISNGSDEGFSIIPTQTNRMILRIDASDFNTWTYISLNNMSFEKYAIPLSCEGERDGHSGMTCQAVKGNDFTFLSSTPTDTQPEPTEWDFAIHRFDVRTHNGSVGRTHVKVIEDVKKLAFDDIDFMPDIWSETSVMVDLTNMMEYEIGYQNILSNPGLWWLL